MRQDDVNELLKEVDEIISMLEKKRTIAGGNSAIKEISKPKVKSAHEHLRSILEYIAKDTYEILQKKYAEDSLDKKKTKTEVKFPVREKPKDFKEKMNKDFFKLDHYYPKIYALFESIQTYSSSPQWASALFKATNDNKHEKLSIQERHDKISLSSEGKKIFSFNENASITMEGNVINGIKQKGIIKIANSKVISGELPKEWSLEKSLEFRIKGTYQDLISQLTLYHKNVTDFKLKFYEILLN